MCDEIRWTHVERTHTHKPCYGCLAAIEKRTKSMYLKGVFEGNFRIFYYCLSCHQTIQSSQFFPMKKGSLVLKGKRPVS